MTQADERQMDGEEYTMSTVIKGQIYELYTMVSNQGKLRDKGITW